MPAVVLLAVFLAGPIVYCVYAAFTNMAAHRATAGTQFVGFDNFTRAFADPAFCNSVWLTVVFVVGSAVIGQNSLGMVLALLMRSGHSRSRARCRQRVVIGAWVLPEVVAGYRLVRLPLRTGTLNAILRRACTFRRRTGCTPCRCSRCPRQHLARHGVLDAGLLRRAVRRAARNWWRPPRWTAPAGARLLPVTCR